MTEQATQTAAVRKSVTVRAPLERAFTVFTEGMGSWWPLATHHIAEEDAVEVVIEPRDGGRWFERAASGAECDWGRVLAYEPPARVLLAWHLDPDFKYEPDPAMSTEVEVRFIAQDDSTTRVELEHRGFEVWGDRAETMREPINGEGGWTALLGVFAEVARAA